jgi:hypothetical protein
VTSMLPYQGGMRRSRCVLAIVLGIVVSCRSLPRGGPPSSFESLPWSDAAEDQAVLQARRLVERGHVKEGLDRLDAVLRDHPRHVDARRLRQDVLTERGRRGLLQVEAQQAIANGDDALAFYLHGRVVSGTADKLRSFGRAAELSPNSLWPWLGLAHTLLRDDPNRAETIYAQLYEASDAHPLVAVAYGALLREREQWDLARAVYTRLVKDPRLPGVGNLGLAQVGLGAGQDAEAWQNLVAAERLRPFDPSVQSLVLRWLQAGASREREAELLDALRADPAALFAFGEGEGAPALAELLQRGLQPLAARAVLMSRDAAGRSPMLRRLLRHFTAALGDVGAFLAIVKQDVPREVVAAESNELRVRWLHLLDGPWYQGDALATAAQSVELLDALLRTGFVAEVEQLAAVAIQRWPGDEAISQRRDEARRELSFEAGLRRLLYQGYREGKVQSVAPMLGKFRELSQQVFGRDVVGSPDLFVVPMVGELQDPFTGDLSAHFDRYNRHFVLGRRAGGVVEGMLLSRLSVAELPAWPELPLAGRCLEVVGMDRDVRAMSGVVGGDLAGVALLNHFLIDHDSVRDWSRTIADRRRVAAEDGGALLRDPLPADAGMDPLDVSWRLSVLSPVQDTHLDAAVLDMIRTHERQHLVDSFHFLPIEHNLGRGLSLLLQFGMSPSAIEAEMERRAELAALALSPHTYLVLAHIADFLRETDAESPHYRGFGALARQLVSALEQLGVAASAAQPSRWHALDPAVVRAAARNLLRELR